MRRVPPTQPGDSAAANHVLLALGRYLLRGHILRKDLSTDSRCQPRQETRRWVWNLRLWRLWQRAKMLLAQASENPELTAAFFRFGAFAAVVGAVFFGAGGFLWPPARLDQTAGESEQEFNERLRQAREIVAFARKLCRVLAVLSLLAAGIFYSLS